MANDPNEVAVALFSGAISDIRGVAIILEHTDTTNGKNLYKDNTENFFTLTTVFENMLDQQVKTLRILATFDLDSEEMNSKFESSSILEKARTQIKDITGEAFENLLSFWSKDSIDIIGTIESAKRI